MRNGEIISSLEMTLKFIEKKLQEIKEIDRSDPEHFESQENYEKLMEAIQEYYIGQLKRFSRDQGAL